MRHDAIGTSAITPAKNSSLVQRFRVRNQEHEAHPRARSRRALRSRRKDALRGRLRSRLPGIDAIERVAADGFEDRPESSSGPSGSRSRRDQRLRADQRYTHRSSRRAGRDRFKAALLGHGQSSTRAIATTMRDTALLREHGQESERAGRAGSAGGCRADRRATRTDRTPCRARPSCPAIQATDSVSRGPVRTASPQSRQTDSAAP